jgi:hypothetical protein
VVGRTLGCYNVLLLWVFMVQQVCDRLLIEVNIFLGRILAMV